MGPPGTPWEHPAPCFCGPDHGAGAYLTPGCLPHRLCGGSRERVLRGRRPSLPHKGEISLSSVAEAGDRESSSSERA